VSGGDAVRTLLRGLGQTLITVGVVVLLFCVYELRVTNLYTAQEQGKLGDRLVEQWAGPVTDGRVPVAFDPGQGIARLYLPTLGTDEVTVVVEGVGTDDLKRGPGHYPGTALPGNVGNVVLSGHRTTYGAPFNRLDELTVGAAVVLETRGFWYTYRVTGTTIVPPSDIGVTLPVPDRAGATPTERFLTLTTCNPKYSATTRLIVRALLNTRLAKGPGVLPPALEG
jgi:sortase A